VSIQVLSDDAARQRIATDLDANLVIEAGAGTGKTSVLVERVTNLLATGRVTADQLAVITFTERAAAELSTRVRDALERRANTATGAEAERLLRAARDLYRAEIETIHSFAATLLRERPVEAGIDPLFEVLDQLTAGLEFDRAYERFQDELLSESRPELERALRRGLGLTELREACEHLNTHRYLLPLNHHELESDDIEAVVERLTSIAEELRQMLARYQPGEDSAVPYVEGIIDWVDDLNGLAPTELERHVLFRRRAKTHGRCGNKANWGGEVERMRELQSEYVEALKDITVVLRTNALLGLLPHIERFAADYEIDRKKRGLADFDDLLFWARNLLRDSQPARDYFRRRFRAVLIDEFQDTDPVQAELALLLTSDEQPGEDWRTLKPAPGRLTVVGDPKQSIYRFRRADISVYDQVKDAALADGQVQISTNFRSNPQLLDGLNAAFDKILQAQPGVQPGNVTLLHPPNAEESRRHAIVLAEGTAEGNAEEIRRAEAGVIAGLLYRAQTEAWEIRDRNRENEWRRCRWGDMAILLPARTGLELYEQALADAGIPYRHEGSRDFFNRDEVRDLIWVLSAVDDPTDRVALVGALRSSAFAVSDEQLVIHTAAVGHLSYRSTVQGPSEPVNHASEELRDLHQLRRSVSLAELIRRTVERTRLVEFALTKPDGDQGAANLLAIVEDARLFSAAGGGGLRPFIRYLRDSMEDEAIEIEATVAEETDDVVRIMTMHGAKGLEYPIVALANLGSQPHTPSAPVPREHEHRLHFRVGADTRGRSGHFATPDYHQVWEEEKTLIEAERLRLLYVAATRARDHLLIPCVTGRHAAKHLLAELVAALPCDDTAVVTVVDADEIAAPAIPIEPDRPVPDSDVDAAIAGRTEWLEIRDELRKRAGVEREIETASSRERAYGPLAAEVSTFGATLMVHDGPPIPVGDAVHMVMERITLPDAHDLKGIAEDVCLEGDIADQLDDVIAMCRACLRSGSVQSAIAAGRLWREVPFVLSQASSSGDAQTGPLATGRVDLVYQDGQALVVVDYKTDKDVTEGTAEAHALEHHSGQAEVYSQALSSATGLPVREVVFVYCRAGVEVRMRDSAAR
jgi:ATP-dependent exoDNAse (exonuclease V) beta subunit